MERAMGIEPTFEVWEKARVAVEFSLTKSAPSNLLA
jgi:hypothetical protein